MKKDLISIKDLTLKEIDEIFDLTDRLKKNKAKFSKALAGKTLALIFQKPSNRTRVSFEVGMYQLGGYSVYLGPDEINLGVRESIHDVAKTLSRYVNGIVLRTFEHKNTVEMAKFSTIPVINGLSDFSHPCQAMADIYSVKEKLKNIKGKTLAYIGDGNNVCNSLIFACDKVGMNINVATPGGYEPSREILKTNPGLNLFNDPFSAVKDVDVIYTDVWASMGQEAQAQERKRAFQGFQINTKLVSLAKKNVLIMHCLPAHRGQEITEEVIDSPNSIVFDQAENRMHVQKAILIKLLGGKCPAS
ncbi:MAG: ornithine carbamoyltransferase [Candidatus Omnitrophota bacterium]